MTSELLKRNRCFRKLYNFLNQAKLFLLLAPRTAHIRTSLRRDRLKHINLVIILFLLHILHIILVLLSQYCILLPNIIKRHHNVFEGNIDRVLAIRRHLIEHHKQKLLQDPLVVTLVKHLLIILNPDWVFVLLCDQA